MSSPSGTTEASDAQTLVLQEAEAARVAANGADYVFGGSTTDGFDCSGFVIYVFNKAYGSNTLARVTANDLRDSNRFSAVTDPKPGDLVFFSASAGGSTASHVGIVVDAERWIGSQSSTGVAYVKFSNSYWKPRILSYGRYKPMQTADAIIPMRAGGFASTIRV
ncbi:C40 family peptidase [Roseomonas sp. F4]